MTFAAGLRDRKVQLVFGIILLAVLIAALVHFLSPDKDRHLDIAEYGSMGGTRYCYAHGAGGPKVSPAAALFNKETSDLEVVSVQPVSQDFSVKEFNVIQVRDSHYSEPIPPLGGPSLFGAATHPPQHMIRAKEAGVIVVSIASSLPGDAASEGFKVTVKSGSRRGSLVGGASIAFESKC